MLLQYFKRILFLNFRLLHFVVYSLVFTLLLFLFSKGFAILPWCYATYGDGDWMIQQDGSTTTHTAYVAETIVMVSSTKTNGLLLITRHRCSWLLFVGRSWEWGLFYSASIEAPKAKTTKFIGRNIHGKKVSAAINDNPECLRRMVKAKRNAINEIFWGYLSNTNCLFKIL